MARQRITLTLPDDVVAQARAACQGNLSGYVTEVLREHLEATRRAELRQALIEGCREEAESDRALSEEFRYADYEVTVRFVPEE